MHAIDTNVLVRLLARDDANQVATAEAFVDKGAWVSLLVLAETVWVLASAYDVDAKGIATAVEMLLHHERVAVQDSDVVAAALAQFRKKPATSFTDCLIIELARKSGHLPLGTFDRDLARIPGAALLR